MSIGEVLSDARCRSGLSVSDVSRQTRIREGVIWNIELDDYSLCGGDFYARGHIRAIASVVGVDPAPLIAEYDAAHQAQPEDDGPPLLTLRPPDPTGRHDRRQERSQYRNRVPWIAVPFLIVLAILGWESYHFAHSIGQSRQSAAQAAFNRTHPSTKHTPSGKPTKATQSPSSSPPDTATPQLVAVKPVSATAYGPDGNAGDNPQTAALAIDSSGSTAWHSDWYTTPAFGNLESGTGLLLDLGHNVTVTSAEIAIGAPGATVQLRAGSSAGDLRLIGGTKHAGSTAVVRPEQVSVRYLLIWFTALPPDSTGTYQAAVSNVALQGRP